MFEFGFWVQTSIWQSPIWLYSKKQTSNNYRLALVQELPLMHDVTRVVIPASKEEAQFLSSTTAHDASLSCDLFYWAHSSDRQTRFKDVQSFLSGASWWVALHLLWRYRQLIMTLCFSVVHNTTVQTSLQWCFIFISKVTRLAALDDSKR